MRHYYINSSFGKDNWFTYEKVYSYFANALPDNGLFVEIGSWTGRSICYLGVEIINLHKKVHIECIDIWPDDINSLPFNQTIKHRYKDKELYRTFLSNIEPLQDIISHKRMSSLDAVKYFEDKSIDILFIDGDHSYNGVKTDIENYLPKIKPGGIIAGHDYNKYWDGVIRAVDEIFNKNIIVQNGCWIKHL